MWIFHNSFILVFVFFIQSAIKSLSLEEKLNHQITFAKLLPVISIPRSCLVECPALRSSRLIRPDIQIHPNNIKVRVRKFKRKPIKLTVICSYSCQRCHRTHHHIPALTASAVYRVAFEACGAAVRYDQLKSRTKLN